MQDVTLGIDIGTSGVRIAARNEAGLLCALSEASMPVPQQSSEHIEQDPYFWWQALEQAFSALDLKGLHVKAIAVDGTSGTVLPIDANGKPLALASMYNDWAELSHISNVTGAAPLDTAARGSTSPLARAMAMPKQARKILHQADWIMGKFCNCFDVTDENNALKSGYDPINRQWPEWIEKSNFNTKLFPEAKPIGTKIGEISKSIALQFDLPQSVAIVTGTTDGCAAFLASGAREIGDGVTSLGTTLTLKLLSERPIGAPEFGIYSHRIRNQWLAGGASNSGGKVLTQEFSKAEIASFTEKIQPEKPTGLNYYPLPAPGERFPINDAAMAPRLVPRPASGIEYFQAILEGIAQIESLGYQRLAQLGASPLRTIRTVGGGAKNNNWTAIRSKLLAVPTLSAASEQAAMGAARLAWWGLNVEN